MAISDLLSPGRPENFGIAPGIAARLRSTLDATDPHPACVWIFGSRARGFARLESDIDLAVDAPQYNEAQFRALRRRIEDLELIYRLDLVWLQDVRDERFRHQILAHRKLFWAGDGMPQVQAPPAAAA